MDLTGTRTWVEKLDIKELVDRYADGVNRADWEQVRSVYADHAVWESPALGMYYATAQEFCELGMPGTWAPLPAMS
jgi:ketosteroid isomerase-like protein